MMCGSREVTVLPESQPVPPGQVEMFPFGVVDQDMLNPDDNEGHQRAMVSYVERLRVETTPTDKDRVLLERLAEKRRLRELRERGPAGASEPPRPTQSEARPSSR